MLYNTMEKKVPVTQIDWFGKSSGKKSDLYHERLPLYEELAKKMKGWTVTVSRDVLEKDWGYWDTVYGILNEPKKRRNRTDEQVRDNCRSGFYAEIGACLLGLECGLSVDRANENDFEYKNRNSYANDINLGGYKVQVKSTTSEAYQARTNPVLKFFQADGLVDDVNEKRVELVLQSFVKESVDKSSADVVYTALIDGRSFLPIATPALDLLQEGDMASQDRYKLSVRYDVDRGARLGVAWKLQEV